MQHSFRIHWRPVAVCLVLALPVLLSACARRPDPPRDRRVIVQDFNCNLPSADCNRISGMLADLMTTHLANQPFLEMIEREQLPVRVSQLSLSGNRWQKLGRATGWDYVVQGSVSLQGRNYVLSSHILSLETGSIVKGTAVSRACDREEDFYPIIQAMSREISYYLKYLDDQHDARGRAAHGGNRSSAAPTPQPQSPAGPAPLSDSPSTESEL